jgi:hypothetical protein
MLKARYPEVFVKQVSFRQKPQAGRKPSIEPHTSRKVTLIAIAGHAREWVKPIYFQIKRSALDWQTAMSSLLGWILFNYNHFRKLCGTPCQKTVKSDI